ncbi:hypothetical protein Tco_1305922, partial [Tanacetum coccineum]
PQKRLCIAPGPRYKVRESSSAPTARPTRGFRADYGITDIWEDLDEIAEEIPATNVAELGQRMNNFVMTVRQDTNEIYWRLNDAQDDRPLMSGQLNLLRRDRRAHAPTSKLMESEARLSRKAWVQSMDASDMTRSKTQMAALQSQQTPARDPTHPDKMPPRKAPRSRTNPAATIATTSVNDEQPKRLIAQGVADVLAEREATRSGNGEDIHDSRMGGRRL